MNGVLRRLELQSQRLELQSQRLERFERLEDQYGLYRAHAEAIERQRSAEEEKKAEEIRVEEARKAEEKRLEELRG